MIKLAKISSIDKRTVKLNFQSSSECIDCESNCSNGFLDFLFHKNTNLLVVALKKSDLGNHCVVDEDSFFDKPHKVNDIVGMKFNEGQLLKLSLLLYGLPIILLLISLILGYVAFYQINLNQDLGGFLGLILGLVIAKKTIKYFKSRTIPEIIFFK